MEPFDIIDNITGPLFKIILVTIKEMFYLTKLMSCRFFSFILEIDRFSTCNFGIYSQDWQLYSEFITEFLRNVALRNPDPCFVMLYLTKLIS